MVPAAAAITAFAAANCVAVSVLNAKPLRQLTPHGKLDQRIAYALVKPICNVAICEEVSVALKASARQTTFSTCVVAELQSAVVAVVTVKSLADVALTLFTVTAILPVVAPLGTATVSCVAVADDTVAVVPLNVTVLAEAVVLKFVPVIITVVSATPLVGVKLVMVGDTVLALSSSSSLQADTMHRHIITAAALASTANRVRIVFSINLVMFI